MGLYIVLKPCLKGENTNIIKYEHNYFFLSKNINFFQKVKNLLRWNILKQHAQWFSCGSLISIKSKQVSKICSMVKRLSHLMHTGGSSPFNKKEWVIKEWPMYNWAITVSSFLLWMCKSEDKQYILLILEISYIIYIFICAWFQVWEQDELNRNVAIKGILSCRICSQISPNANMAGNPDENNHSPLSCHFCI